jgi:hypothetical protein
VRNALASPAQRHAHTQCCPLPCGGGQDDCVSMLAPVSNSRLTKARKWTSPPHLAQSKPLSPSMTPPLPPQVGGPVQMTVTLSLTPFPFSTRSSEAGRLNVRSASLIPRKTKWVTPRRPSRAMLTFGGFCLALAGGRGDGRELGRACTSSGRR